MSDLKTWYRNLQRDKIGSGKTVLNTVEILTESLRFPDKMTVISEVFAPFKLGVELWRDVRNHSSYDKTHCAAMLVQMAMACNLEEAIQEELGYNPSLSVSQKAGVLQRELRKQIPRFDNRTLDIDRIPMYRLGDNKLVRMSQVIWTAWFNVVEYQSGEEWLKFDSTRLLGIALKNLFQRIFRIVRENWEVLPELAHYLRLLSMSGLSMNALQWEYLSGLACLDRQLLFNSSHSYRELYVPLEAFVLEEAEWSNRLERHELVDLFSHVEKSFQDTTRVTFVEGRTGAGKSMFCAMLAAFMAKNALISRDESPPFFPVLLPLEQLQEYFLSGTFEDMLEKVVESHFPLDKECLELRPFLFILDGFDALMPVLARERGALQDFFSELESFQQRWSNLPDGHSGHKVFITGRPMSLESRRLDVPVTFERLEVAPFSSQQIEKWLNNWGKDELGGKKAAEKLTEELTEHEVFSQFGSYQEPTIIQRFASQPMLLYMMAQMSAADRFPHPQDQDIHKRADFYHAYVRHLYRQSFKDGSPQVRQLRRELNLGQEDILQVLRETGFLIYQRGGVGTPLENVRQRLERDYFNTSLMQQPEAARLFVRSFYLRSEQHQGTLKPRQSSPLLPRGKFNFHHRSLMEYLTAERLLQVIEELVERRKFVGTYNRRPRFTLRIEAAAQLMYENFGIMHPNLEVLAYLDGFLPWLFYWEGNEEKSQTREEIRQVRQRYPLTDFLERLETLFTYWLNGEWSSRGFSVKIANDSPQGVGGLEPHLIELSTGFVMLEMLALCLHHLNRGLDFQSSPEISKNWLNRMHAYASFNNQSELWFQFTRFLSYANLHAADLSRLDLSSATLKFADLQYSNLQHVDLQYASLQDSRLQNANLQHANLQKANLVNANLVDANLHSAYLIDANLTDVYLLEANLIEARLQNANLENAKLQYARLNDAKLQNANLRNAKLQKADLTNADLRGADLTNADLRGAELKGARLDGARLDGVTR